MIFIDDLDRCTPSKIAKVVEGVSMFLASDLYRCLFVIGMDPQLIAAALETEHADVIAKLPSYERAVPVGWRFMDKFVQLPFTIPPCSPKALEGFIDGFGRPAPAPSPRSRPQPETDRAASAAPAGPAGRAQQSEPSVSLLQAAARRDVESRDVGALVRELLTIAAGNPRELKRMANLARLYLELRNARRASDGDWRSPSLNAYARWITLTSRWPDAMRWLLWGADEASWSPADLGEALVVRRLHFMEAAAGRAKAAPAWQVALRDTLRVPVADPSDWANDVKLFDLFVAEADRPAPDRLSAAAKTEFW